MERYCAPSASTSGSLVNKSRNVCGVMAHKMQKTQPITCPQIKDNPNVRRMLGKSWFPQNCEVSAVVALVIPKIKTRKTKVTWLALHQSGQSVVPQWTNHEVVHHGHRAGNQLLKHHRGWPIYARSYKRNDLQNQKKTLAIPLSYTYKCVTTTLSEK